MSVAPDRSATTPANDQLHTPAVGWGGNAAVRWTEQDRGLELGADLRAARVEAPMLAREMRPTELIGRLVAVEEAVNTRRLTIEVASIDGVEQSALPKRVRVSWRGSEFGVLPGDMISLRAGLSPPPKPHIQNAGMGGTAAPKLAGLKASIGPIDIIGIMPDQASTMARVAWA